MSMVQVSNNSSFSNRLVFMLAVLSLLIVPLHGVLVYSQVLLALEVLALLSLFIIFWSGLYKGGTYGIVLWFLLISLVLACLYIVPIPQGLDIPFIDLSHLPGRSLYDEVDQWLVARGEPSNATLSLIPYESTLALLALMPPLAIFFSAISVSEAHLRNLIYLLLLIAGVQAALGLIQYATSNPDFYFGMKQNGRSAQGTYLNRDHFSAFLEMMLPITIGLMLYSIGGASHGRRHDAKAWILNQVLIFGFLALLIFLAAIFARSRTGVFLIMVAVLISSFVFSRHVGGKKSVGLTAVFATIAVGLATSIGLIPVLNRFVSRNPVEDERFRIFGHTLDGIKAFFPFGSGPGTFSNVYPAFQPVEQLGFVNSAHNDYLELLFDLGALGVFIIAGFLFVYIFGWFKLAGKLWSRLHFIKVAAGISILLLSIHLLSDFILHEPMNTMVFALLLGTFLRKPSKV